MTPPSVASPASNGKAGTTPSRRWSGNGHRDPIGQIVARVLGMTPMSAEHLVRSLNHRTAAVVHAFKQIGDDERLGRFMEPIHRALEGREPPPDVEASWIAAQTADALEDIDELRYHLDRSDRNLAKLIKSKRETLRFETATLDMLIAEQRQRKSGASVPVPA